MKFHVSSIAAFAALAISGCTSNDTTEWIELDRAWYLTLSQESATIQDAVLGQKSTLRATIEGDVVLLHDDKGEIFGENSTIALAKDEDALDSFGREIDLRFVPLTEQTSGALINAALRKRDAHQSRQRPAPSSDDGYTLMTSKAMSVLIAAYRTGPGQAGRRSLFGDNAAWPFLTHAHRNMSDDELASEFVPGYRDESNAFKRAELLESVSKYRSAMNALRRPIDFRLRFRVMPAEKEKPFSGLSEDAPPTLTPFNLDTKTFVFTDRRTPCSALATMNYPYMTYRHPIGLTRVLPDGHTGCRFEVKDPMLARRIESARADGQLLIEAEVFVRLNGEVMRNERFGVTPIFEVQKVIASFYDASGSPLIEPGPTDAFVIWSSAVR